MSRQNKMATLRRHLMLMLYQKIAQKVNVILMLKKIPINRWGLQQATKNYFNASIICS